jgi:ubiquinone/menaquinone biosynthesis C-methylase UbiE
MMPVPQTNNSYRVVDAERMRIIRQYAGRSVLDVGCGNGCYVLGLADKYDVHGVDIQPYDTWRAKPDLFALSDAIVLPFPDRSIDTVICVEVLEHIQHPETALREMHRVCRNHVIVSVPNCNVSEGMQTSRVVFAHWIDRTHVNFFDMESISSLIAQSGFRIVEKKSVDKISLVPLINEAYGPKGWLGILFRGMLRLLRRQDYFLACLIVGEKKTL